jgi:hypothetical protein
MGTNNTAINPALQSIKTNLIQTCKRLMGIFFIYRDDVKKEQALPVPLVPHILILFFC